MRVTLIHNPGAGDGKPTPTELRTAFEEAGYIVRYASSEAAGWERELREPADLVVAAGGDGTVANVVPLLVGRGVPLAMLSLGTANNIALTLELPDAWRAAVTGLSNGRRQRFDCGRVSGPWGTHSFIESVGAGAFAHLIAAAQSAEDTLAAIPLPGRFDQIRRSFAQLLSGLDAGEYQIDADGEDLSGRYLLVEAMNIRSIGPRVRIAPDADSADGMLDLVLVEADARERFAAAVNSWLDQTDAEREWPLHQVRRVRSVRITGEQLAWHVDDELRPIQPSTGEPLRASGTVTVELTGYVDLVIPILPASTQAHPAEPYSSRAGPPRSHRC